MSLLRGRIAFAVVIATLAAVIALVALLYIGSADDDGPGGAAAAQNDPTVAQIETQAEAGATRSDAAAPSTKVVPLPEIAATEVRGVGPKDVQIDASVLALSKNGMDLYLTPTRESRWTCISLVSSDGATVSCTPLSAVADGTAPPASEHRNCRTDEQTLGLTCATTVYYGVVPDAVNRVELSVQRGRAPAVDVANGAYLVEVDSDQRPTTIAFSGADGVAFSQPAPATR